MVPCLRGVLVVTPCSRGVFVVTLCSRGVFDGTRCSLACVDLAHPNSQIARVVASADTEALQRSALNGDVPPDSAPVDGSRTVRGGGGAYTHTHTCTHSHAYTHTHTHIHTHIHTHTHARTHMYFHTRPRTHAHSHACRYVRVPPQRPDGLVRTRLRHAIVHGRARSESVAPECARARAHGSARGSPGPTAQCGGRGGASEGAGPRCSQGAWRRRGRRCTCAARDLSEGAGGCGARRAGRI